MISGRTVVTAHVSFFVDDWRCAIVKRTRNYSIRYCEIMPCANKLNQIKGHGRTFQYFSFVFLCGAINKIATSRTSFERPSGHFVMAMHKRTRKLARRIEMSIWFGEHMWPVCNRQQRAPAINYTSSNTPTSGKQVRRAHLKIVSNIENKDLNSPVNWIDILLKFASSDSQAPAACNIWFPCSPFVSFTFIFCL